MLLAGLLLGGCVHTQLEPASEANEEYLWSEKYELKRRDWDAPGSLAPFVMRINEIRRRHPAFARGDVDDADLVAYAEHDLIGESPSLRSSVSEPAVRGEDRVLIPRER